MTRGLCIMWVGLTDRLVGGLGAGLFRPYGIPFKTTSGGSNPGQIEQPRTGNLVKSRVWHRPERGDPIQNLKTKTGKPLKSACF